MPQGGPQAWKPRTRKDEVGSGSQKNESTNEIRTKTSLPSSCFFSTSRDWRVSSASRCSLRYEASCSSRAWRWSSCEMLICTSSLLRRDTSSSCFFAEVLASSSVACSRWSWPNASSRARRPCSSEA
jgi:hypothetical protein